MSEGSAERDAAVILLYAITFGLGYGGYSLGYRDFEFTVVFLLTGILTMAMFVVVGDG